MSMTKMECAVSTAWDDVGLDGTNQWIAEALDAGSTAIDLLQSIYWMFEDDPRLKPYMHEEIRSLMEKWN